MTDASRERPALFAHRGFAGEAPENTVAAVSRAARQGADWVEVDVQPTADGDVVAIHDPTLSGRDGPGLTDETGVVWETNTATVTGATVLDSGETVPLLATVLDALPADVGVNVELKNPGRWDVRPDEKLAGEALAEREAAWRPFVEDVLGAVEGREHDVLCSSFCEGALAAVRATSSLPVAPLVSESVADGLAIAREHDAAAIHPPIDAIRGTPYFDADRFGGSDGASAASLVEVAHADGFAVNVWTVRTWHQADRLAAAGVDGVIADYSTLVRD